jgi:putative FmdB family regulatory protein
VPTYDYQCDQCHRTFEVRQRITEDPLTLCEECGGPLRRLLSAAPFILKGEGWYVTDYPSESRKKALDSEKKSAPSAEQSSTSTSSPTPTTNTSTGNASTGSASNAGSSTASSSD